MLVLSVWVSLQCVGGWVPVKWRNRLITDWRQTQFLSSYNSSQTEGRKRDSSRCKKPLSRCHFAPPEAANDRSSIYISFAYYESCSGDEHAFSVKASDVTASFRQTERLVSTRLVVWLQDLWCETPKFLFRRFNPAEIMKCWWSLTVNQWIICVISFPVTGLWWLYCTLPAVLGIHVYVHETGLMSSKVVACCEFWKLVSSVHNVQVSLSDLSLLFSPFWTS